jgi:hypothetical protein
MRDGDHSARDSCSVCALCSLWLKACANHCKSRDLTASESELIVALTYRKNHDMIARRFDMTTTTTTAMTTIAASVCGRA